MISFSCVSCFRAYTAPDDKAGKTAQCPACGAKIVVPQPNSSTQPPATERPRKASAATEQGGASSPKKIKKRRPMPWSIVLWGLGAFLLILAWGINGQIDAKEVTQGRIDDSLYRFTVNTGGSTTYRSSPASDRSSVYFFAGAGALCVIGGFVCRSLEDNRTV